MSLASQNRAYAAGRTYWIQNKPYEATLVDLASLARSCGWHDDDCDAWLAGFSIARAQAERALRALREHDDSESDYVAHASQNLGKDRIP